MRFATTLRRTIRARIAPVPAAFVEKETIVGVHDLATVLDGTLLVARLTPGSVVDAFDIATGASLARFRTCTTLAHGVAVRPESR